MNNQYMVTSSGMKGGKTYSSLTKIVQGTKENGDRYAFLDTKTPTIRETEELTLGAIYEYSTARIAPNKGGFPK